MHVNFCKNDNAMVLDQVTSLEVELEQIEAELAAERARSRLAVSTILMNS